MTNANPQPNTFNPSFQPVGPSPASTTPSPQKKGLFSSFTKKTWYLIGGLVALIVLVGGSGAGLYLAQNQSGDLRNQACLACDGGTCGDGSSYGPDSCAPQSSCSQRATEACQNKGGPASGGGQTSGSGNNGGSGSSNTCDNSSVTAAACRGKNVGDRVGGTCTCFRTTGTLCGCRADSQPSPSVEPARTCAAGGGTNITSGPNTGKCQCPGGQVVTQQQNCPADKTGLGGNKETPTGSSRTCSSIGATDITSGANTGKCLCANGNVVTQSGSCTTARTCSSIGATDITSGANTGKCLCPSGFVTTQSGSCPSAARTCSSIGATDITSGANTGKCLCPGGSVVTQSGTCPSARTCSSIGATDITSGANTGKCLCANGNVVTQSGSCTTARTCSSIGATDITSGANTGKCLCPGGSVVTQSGTCPTAAKTCSSIGATDITSGPDTGKCRCLSGKVVTQSGNCNTVGGVGTGTGGTGTGTGGTGTGGTGTGGNTATGGMCPNSPTTPIKKYIKFTCPNGCTVTTEGGVTAARCYQNRVESTSPLSLGANECGQVDALSGDSDSTYCGYTQYKCDGSCAPTTSSSPRPTPSATPTTYACNSRCTTNAQCQGEDSRFRCLDTASGVKRCRLNSNPTSNNCQPAVGPQCLAIRLRKADGVTPIKFGENDPKLGENITLLCGKVDAAAKYVFRVVDPDGERTRLESTGQVSAPFKITKAGKYTAQCQICTGESNDTCLPFENLNTLNND